jgi:hypothetical protein
MVVYPQMTAIDLIAPQLLFATLGNVDVHLVWKDRTAVISAAVRSNFASAVVSAKKAAGIARARLSL